MIKCKMKFLLCAGLLVLVSGVVEGEHDLPSPPPSAFADAESSGTKY